MALFTTEGHVSMVFELVAHFLFDPRYDVKLIVYTSQVMLICHVSETFFTWHRVVPLF